MGTVEFTILNISMKGAGIYGQTLAAIAFLMVLGMIIAWRKRG